MSELHTLSQQECWRRLADGRVGRVAFTERALPAIRPVNYALVGRHIVLRTRGDGLAAKLDGQVVAFEIDEVDEQAGAGWSVVVTGTARLPRSPAELARLGAHPLSAWAGADHCTSVWITPGDVQGRRVAAARSVSVVRGSGGLS